MIASPGGKNKVEVTLAFTTDPSQATAGMNKMTAAAKDLSASAKSAQASMSGMKGPGGSSSMPTPYGVQGSTYGVQASTANRIGFAPPSASGGPAFPSTVAGPGGQRFSYEAYTGAQKSIASDAKSKEQAAAMAAISPAKPFSGGFQDIAVKGAIALTAINSLTRGLEILGDTTKGSAAKVLGAVEMLPVVGGSAAGLSRAAINLGEYGLRKGIGLSDLASAAQDAKGQIRFAGDQKLTGARREAESVMAGSRGFFGGGVVVPVDGEDERVTQAKMDEARAKRAANAAAKDQAAFGKELKQANLGVDINQRAVDAAAAAEREAKAKRDQAAKGEGFYSRNAPMVDFMINPLMPLVKAGFGGYKDKSSLNGIEEGIDTNRQRKDLGRALLAQEEALRTEKDKQLNTQMKLSEYEKARTETMKAQAAVLKDQLATAKAQERSAGSMSDEDKKELLAAAQEAKQKGLGNISEERRNMLLSSSLTSGYFGKEAERLGAMDPTLNAIRGITGEKGSGQLTNELKDIAAKIDVKIDIDENALAEKLAGILGPFFKKLELIIGKQVNNAADQLDTDAERARKTQEASI